MSDNPLKKLLGLSTLVTAMFLPQPAGGASSNSLEPVGKDPVAIGKYPVHAMIGQGGEAAVYLGEHPTLGNEVVLKWAHSAETGSRLQSEGRLLTRIDSANVVRALDLDEHEERPFLVLEPIDGTTLAERVHRRPPTMRQSAGWIAAIAEAVDRVHQLGFVHQDINPANVLIDGGDEPKLIDFGLSRRIDADPGVDGDDLPCGGTLAYMAPEQARQDSPSIGVTTDVFGLGATLFFCLTGAPPYDVDSAQEAWERARRGDFDGATLIENRVPWELRGICARAMSETREGRYATAGALANALRAWLA